MSRRLIVLASVSVLVLAFAGASSADNSVSLSFSPSGPNQFVFQVQNAGDTMIQSFVLVLGSGFSVGSLVSPTGNCSLSGDSVSCTGLSLAPGCTCNPGQSAYITLSGNGDPTGSAVVNVVGSAVPTGTSTTSNPVPQTSSSTKTTTTTTTSKPAVTLVKKIPRCRKGQHSTKKKPCRR
jgi:hypothetical protein